MLVDFCILCCITVACSRGYCKRPNIDPSTVQLQNNCTAIGSYARRFLYRCKNRCKNRSTISIGNHMHLSTIWE